MKMRSVTKILTAGAIALSATAIIQQPGSAQATGFKCETGHDGSPTVYAETPGGDRPIIVFEDNTYPGWPPARRCGAVAERFKKFARDENGNWTGKIGLLTVGYVNDLPVICAVHYEDTPCNNQTLLLTLRPGYDAAKIVYQLFNVRYNGGGPVPNSGDNRLVLNFEDFLNSRPVENVDSSSSPPTPMPQPIPQQSPPPGPNNDGGVFF